METKDLFVSGDIEKMPMKFEDCLACPSGQQREQFFLPHEPISVEISAGLAKLQKLTGLGLHSASTTHRDLAHIPPHELT